MAKKQESGVYPRVLKDGVTVYDLTIMARNKQKRIRAVKVTDRRGRERYATFSEAVRERDRLREEMRAGRLGKGPARLTVGAFVRDTWLPAKLVELEDPQTRAAKPNTESSYRNNVDWIVRLLGDIRLADLSADDVQGFIGDMAKAGLGTTSRSARYHTLKAALHDALVRRYINANPCELVRAPKIARRRDPRLSIAQIKRLLEAADATDYGMLVYLTVMTGLRETEALTLTWAMLDFSTGYLDLGRSKSAAGERIIVLDAGTLARLQSHRFDQLRRLHEAAPGVAPGELIFLNSLFRRVNVKTYWYHWRHIRDAADLPDLHHHDLRHVHATLLAKAHAHPSVMQQRLGHADAETSLDVYTHSDVEEQRTAAEAVAALLS